MSPKKRRNQPRKISRKIHSPETRPNKQPPQHRPANQPSPQPSRQPAKDDPNRPRLPFRTGNRSNTKRVGERSEAAFLDKVSDFGFGVARPWGDSERYDFILDNGLQLIRVQNLP